MSSSSFVRMNPGTNREIARSQLERIAGRDFDVCMRAVERAAVEIDAVIDAVIAPGRSNRGNRPAASSGRRAQRPHQRRRSYRPSLEW